MNFNEVYAPVRRRRGGVQKKAGAELGTTAKKEGRGEGVGAGKENAKT